jgi:hypothetical protein
MLVVDALLSLGNRVLFRVVGCQESSDGLFILYRSNTSGVQIALRFRSFV